MVLLGPLLSPFTPVEFDPHPPICSFVLVRSLSPFPRLSWTHTLPNPLSVPLWLFWHSLAPLMDPPSYSLCVVGSIALARPWLCWTHPLPLIVCCWLRCPLLPLTLTLTLPYLRPWSSLSLTLPVAPTLGLPHPFARLPSLPACSLCPAPCPFTILPSQLRPYCPIPHPLTLHLYLT